MLNYAKLWRLLETKGMKKTDLKQIISSATLAKLGKNEPISSTVIEKICGFLNCQPGDIMEYISEEQMKNAMEQFDKLTHMLGESLKEQGITEEQFATLMQEAIPEVTKSIFNKGDMMVQALEKSKDKSNG